MSYAETLILIKTKKGRRGGILNQGNFDVSPSSAVDPRPPARAQWKSENVFDQEIPDPPNNIGTDVFLSSIELQTFEKRSEAVEGLAGHTRDSGLAAGQCCEKMNSLLKHSCLHFLRERNDAAPPAIALRRCNL